jgi:SAM-dependent methyltransferase
MIAAQDVSRGSGDARTSTITDDDWLRGYFMVMPEADVQGGSRVAAGKRKNYDFLRLKDVALHLVEPGPGKAILEIGCNTGATMIYCGLQGATVDGVDLDAQCVATANAQLRRYGVKGQAHVADATKLPFEKDRFDAVISNDFVEHITHEDKTRMFGECLRVLKPGGVLVTRTPNLGYLRVSLGYKRLRALAKFKNPMRIVIPHTPGTDDPQHIGLATRWDLSKALIDAGFVNHEFVYAPFRRFGHTPLMEVLSTEVPIVRDFLCEDLFNRAYKPIALSHFPD